MIDDIQPLLFSYLKQSGSQKASHYSKIVFLHRSLLRLKLGFGIIFSFKGSNRLCKVVELSMQCCGKLLSDSFETYETF